MGVVGPRFDSLLVACLADGVRQSRVSDALLLRPCDFGRFAVSPGLFLGPAIFDSACVHRACHEAQSEKLHEFLQLGAHTPVGFQYFYTTYCVKESNFIFSSLPLIILSG